MDRNIKNKGRKKHVTSGGGTVKKRGKAKTSGPVGSSSGYSDRKNQKTSSSSSSYSGSSSAGSNLSSLFSSGASSSSSSGTGRQKKPLTLGRIIMFIIIGLVIFFAVRWLFRQMSGDGGLLSGLEGQDLSGVAYEQDDSSSQSSVSDATLDTTVAEGSRDKRTQILGAGQDEMTVMVYMIGSDLESRSGMATKDLQEMIAAKVSDNVNVIVETGGAKKWNNKTVSSSTNQRYQIVSDGIKALEENLGKRNMTDPDTLTDFIKYAKKNFPANRYALIFWDHGAGSVQGFGYDELYGGSSMSLSEIDKALDLGNCEFDFIGFDACLMATFETALVAERYADYLIASEETEPGIGWYYTGWLNALSNDTSMPTIEIGKRIIDDFIDECADFNAQDKTTLSIIDLAELVNTAPEPFKDFAQATAGLINSDDYKEVANARNGTREFGGSAALDQIDLIHLAQNVGVDESQELVDALSSAVKYNRTSPYISNANGISIYFPYDKLSNVGSMVNTYEEIGMDEEYTDCIKSFANLEAGGQVATSGQSSPISSLLGNLTGGSGGSSIVPTLINQFIGGGNFSSITGGDEGADSWVDTQQIEDSSEYIEQNFLDSDNIQLTEKNDGYVLKLSDDEWDLVHTLNLNIFLDDGEGYIDLGLDNVYEFDNDGDLKIDFDGTWLAVNGQVVSYYFISEEETSKGYVITGRIPAMLNDQLVDLIAVFEENEAYGKIIGARVVYQGETETIAKGLLDIEIGDTIDFLCDYYTYDQEYQASYYLGDTLTVVGSLTLSNVSIGESDCMVTYRLTDMYNNTYWTPAVMYK